jgi:uncharacterized protein YybS (DUF2232 family)
MGFPLFLERVMNYRSALVAVVEAVGLYLSGFFIPVLGQALALFTPVPLIIVYVRNGKSEGLAALGISTGVVAFLAGWQVAALLLFSFGLMAAGTAEGMRRRWKPESAALLGGLLPVAVLGILAIYYFGHSGKNPVASVEAYLRGSIAEAARFYTSLGLAEMAAAVNTVTDTFVHYLVRLIPGIVIATSVLQAACCYGLSRLIISRKPGTAPAPSGVSLAAWHAPDAWVWGLIVALALIMVPNEPAKFAGWNLVILYAVVYLTQGIAIVEHYLRKARIQAVVRGLLHALILALPTVVFVIALGVVDIWADFRKVRWPLMKT